MDACAVKSCLRPVAFLESRQKAEILFMVLWRKTIHKWAGRYINRYLANLQNCIRYPSPENNIGPVRNLLLINTQDKTGGAAKVCKRIFENLNSMGINANLFVKKSFSSDSRIQQIVRGKSLEQKILDIFQKNEGWLDVFHWSSFRIKNLDYFRKADILHLHNIKPGFFSVLALPEITCLKPIVYTLHDMFAITGHCNHSYDCISWHDGCGHCPDLNSPPKILRDGTALLWQLKKLAYDYSSFHIVTPSNWLKEKVSKSMLRNKETTVIYNGVDEKVFKNHNKKEARKRLGLPSEKKILLNVAIRGSENLVKGGHLLDEVMKNAELKEVLLVRIGKAGAETEKEVSFDAIQDEKLLALFYSAADILVSPSLADNCPLVVLEALSCGTPVVAFKTGGIPELVKHKVNGYLAEYNDIAGLAHGINFYLADSSIREKAAREARRTVLEKFTLRDMVNKYLDLYQSVREDFLQSLHIVDREYRIKVGKIIEKYYHQKIA